MEISLLTHKDRTMAFQKLFGQEAIKKVPMYIYAEQLFYQAMDQFLDGYSGGYYDYLTFDSTGELDLNPATFIPKLACEKLYTVSTPYTVRENLSATAASIVVWLFLLEQLSNTVKSDKQANIIKEAHQDVYHSYSKLVHNGSKLLSKADLNNIYKLTN